MIERDLTPLVLDALRDTPVVLIHGPRQAGKSTLARWMAAGPHPARYVTLDDAATSTAAREDPQGFVSNFEGPVVLDEIQKVPELFPAIKLEVDRHRKPGRYLLTGSANIMLVPSLSESLAGRMEIQSLWPLSEREIERRTGSVVDFLFSRTVLQVKGEARDRDELARRVARGGYPEVLTRESERRKQAWFGAHVTTILERDVRSIAAIEGLSLMLRLLQFLAARPCATLNFAETASSLGIPQSTVKRYLALLEGCFLIRRIPAWFSNIRKRLVKTPKVILTDTGLASHLAGVNPKGFLRNTSLFGGLVENFVAMELIKQAGWSRMSPRLFHFRTHAGHEVDWVLESPDGRLVGVEVKASATLTSGDFRGLRQWKEMVKERFVRGVVLYAGTETVSFGKGLTAIPMRILWEDSPS